MNTNNITQICSAVYLYELTQGALSATAELVPNISSIYPSISSTGMGSAALSAYGNITMLSTTILPYVSAL